MQALLSRGGFGRLLYPLLGVAVVKAGAWDVKEAHHGGQSFRDVDSECMPDMITGISNVLNLSGSAIYAHSFWHVSFRLPRFKARLSILAMLSISGGVTHNRTQLIWGSYGTANNDRVPIGICPGWCKAQENVRPVLSLYRKFEKITTTLVRKRKVINGVV